MISLLAFKRTGLLIGALGALLLPALSNAQLLCVRLIGDTGIVRSVPVRLGSVLRLNFRHSIYASQVEEVFLVRDNGFELTQLRYGEARLADFYGHENAQHGNGVWTVTPAPTLLPSVNLRLSADAAMSILIEETELQLQPGSVHRMTVAPCKIALDG